MKILGTLIFEWEQGAEELKELLNSPHLSKLADKLADIAVFFGFDGYLINIESSVATPELAKEFRAWLSDLHGKLLASIPHAEMIWYDSILNEGSL